MYLLRQWKTKVCLASSFIYSKPKNIFFMNVFITSIILTTDKIMGLREIPHTHKNIFFQTNAQTMS